MSSFRVIEMTEFGLSDLVKAVDCKLEFNGMVFKCDNKEWKYQNTLVLRN